MFAKVLTYIFDQKKALVKAGDMNSPEYDELNIMEEAIRNLQIHHTDSSMFPSARDGGRG